jgi:signal peptidase I
MTDKNESGARRVLSGGKRPYMLAIVAAIIVFILVAPVRVHGDNMSPLLNDGDVVIILKSTYYDARLPAYGDVLCFKRSFAPEDARTGDDGGFDERSYRFARVIGLPDDEIEMRADGIYRNDGKLTVPGSATGGNAGGTDETGGAAPESETASVDASGDTPAPDDISGIRKVGAGEMFALNDNQQDMLDSRDDRVDTLLSEARGRVVFRVWPIGRFGIVQR